MPEIAALLVNTAAAVGEEDVEPIALGRVALALAVTQLGNLLPPCAAPKASLNLHVHDD